MTALNFVCGEPIRRDCGLSDASFSALRSMADRSEGRMRIVSKGPDESIVVDGCVVHARFGDGSSLRVSPEGYPSDSPSRMLHSVFNLDYRAGDGEDLFEFIVMLFVRDVADLLRRGLKFAYSLIQANETSFKGRMLFSENIRENLVHKERVFVEYELFSPDRAENRLLKSTLELLVKRSTSSRSRRDIKTLLTELEDIPSSTDILRDLGKVNLDRNMVDYISAISWCEVFLKALGIAGGTSKGDVSFAVVVDAESLTSAYVARMSSRGRMDGSFSARCGVTMSTDGDNGSIIAVDPEWFYYDNRTREQSRDAMRLFETTPGYRVIPAPEIEYKRVSRLDRVAMSLLSD